MNSLETPALYARFQLCGGLVSTVSRQPQPGTLFFALNGPSFRGADFAPAALAAGARFAVVDDAALAAADPARYTFAPDPLAALQALAGYHRRQFAGPVLAISGSNGKTTTKELLTAVLAKKYRVLATVGNLNNHIGVPLTLLRLRLDEHELAVVEMGANHRGEIAGYCQYAQPTHGLLTNIGHAHLEGFGGPEGVALGKGELFDYVAAHGGTLLVNTLDARVLAAAQKAVAANPGGPAPVLGTYPGPADTYPATLLGADPAVVLRFGPAGTEAVAQLTGDYNFPNLAAAAAVGQYFEVPAAAIAAALAGYQPQNNRSQQLRTARGNALVLDAYNANPSSMGAALRSFAQRPGPLADKVVILGDMFELGEASAQEHSTLGDLLNNLDFGCAVLIGPKMGSAWNMADPNTTQHFASKAAAAAWLQQHPLQGRQILLKGSRGMALETLVELL